MHSKRYPLLGLLLSGLALPAGAQTIINSYARVTAISGSTLTIKYAKTSAASLPSLSSNTFVAGSRVILMQMQDNALGSTANDATFGDAVTGAPANAGKFEVITLSSNVVMSGSDSTLTFSGTLSNTYNLGAHTRVQLISYAKLGTPGYTLTTPLAALPWNGARGGVLALEVGGTLTLSSTLSAAGMGFRGGKVSQNADYDQNCEGNYYSVSPFNDSTVNNNNRHGYKGEGIYFRGVDYPVGKGKLLNGGGGGNVNNSGGGGGGNYTSGGIGGPGWYGGGPPPAGCSSAGVGGQALNGFGISRFYMGGGGGGGQQNNNVSSAGASGGGIVMLAANVLATAGTAGTITAAGATAANSGNDGAGGGGAGGSILLQVASYSLSSPLALNVQGGSGGNVGDPGIHGGGGGGGAGVVLTTTDISSVPNATVTTGGGSGGSSGSGGSTPVPSTPGGSPSDPASGGGPTAGPSSTGVVTSTGSTPLPVVLLAFAAQRTGSHRVLLTWQTAQELNSRSFIIERHQENSAEWSSVGEVAAAGQRSSTTAYHFEDDNAPAGRVYYRLRQVDHDGKTAFSPVRTVGATVSAEVLLTAQPNPFDNSLEIVVHNYQPEAHYEAVLFDGRGRQVRRVALGGSRTVLSTTDLPTGLYFVRWASDLTGPSTETIKVVKR